VLILNTLPVQDRSRTYKIYGVNIQILNCKCLIDKHYTKLTTKIILTIAMVALIAAIGSMSIGNMNRNAFARSSDDDQGGNGGNDQQGSNDDGGSSDDQSNQELKKNGLCPPGHDCICTPASGVFHDRTTGFNINTGCTDNKG
jgi:hypothetical protein